MFFFLWVLPKILNFQIENIRNLKFLLHILQISQLYETRTFRSRDETNEANRRASMVLVDENEHD